MDNRIKQEWKQYIPPMLMLDAESIAHVLDKAHQRLILRADAYQNAINDMNKAYARYKIMVHDNNWLKMHGYPKRRTRFFK